MTPAQFLELFLSLSLQTAILVGATRLICSRVHSGATQSRLWMLCSFAELALAAASLLLPHPKHFAPWSTLTDQAVLRAAEFQEQLGQGILALWAIGAMLVTAFLAGELVRTNRFMQTCRPCDIAVDRLLPRAASQIPGSHGVLVLVSESISSPLCWQFHRPYIVLPAALLNLEETRLRMILKHELEHLRTGHPLQLLVQKIVQAVFWYHPSVWWASRQAMLAREFACDDAAIDSPDEVADYLRAMLAVVELGVKENSREGCSLGLGRQRSTLTTRSRRLVALATTRRERQTEISPRVGHGALIAATLVVALTWLPVDALASSRSRWSPWPGWTSKTLHLIGIPVRDFETYDPRTQPYELRTVLTPPHVAG